jgi:hypothetical protein
LTLRVQLTEADRERFSAPEWLDFDASKLMTDEAEVLEESFGIFAAEWIELFSNSQVKRPVKAIRAVIWLALTRAGLQVEPAAVQFDLLGVRIELDEADAEVDQGKGESTPPAASAGSKPATASRSRRSSASGRGKSTG